MLKNLLNNKLKVVVGLFLIFLLIAVRALEDTLFYDPFLNYFKSNYTNTLLPKINTIKLFFSLGFRYYLNSIISLGLIRLVFNDSKILKFSIFLFSVLGIILMISFFFVLLKFGETNKMNLFYIRRFIIQPIFVMLFIPAFYYQKKIK
ncbi:exosortase F system-associated protein [Flavobacterium sp. SUN052]|uniref:exosortase F system-associated membrane protein n=1 Tax=Flavobacterium sp. SUN052 TaxID=3002441 RepID=UPI00237E9745|nr:exosortase F system-associated protein [Flavobacterium sp. SUN052]MEC4003053.1 exosortase F system-associated protein [Flavobacterium sp. SUN052]